MEGHILNDLFYLVSNGTVMNAKENYVNISSQLYTKCGLFLETFPDSVISLDIVPIEKLELPENACNNHAFP